MSAAAQSMNFLDKNIHYYGIDIAIHEPTANLIETDFVENPIGFADRRFDIVVAQGVFEYVGELQDQKFSEIAGLLRDQGTFVLTYTNFGHQNKAGLRTLQQRSILRRVPPEPGTAFLHRTVFPDVSQLVRRPARPEAHEGH